MLKDSFVLTSSISDHSALLLLLEGVGTVDLLDNFWAEAGDLLSPRRVKDLKLKKNKIKKREVNKKEDLKETVIILFSLKKTERQIKIKVLRFLNA